MVDTYNLQKDLSKTIFDFICRHHERVDRSKGGDDEPLPATRSEMIVMALVDIGRPASPEEINLWITNLLGANYREHRRAGYHEYPAECLLTIGDLLYRAFDLPVIEVPPEPRFNAFARSQILLNEVQRRTNQNVSTHGITMGTMSIADPTLSELHSWQIPPSVEDCMRPGPVKWTTPIRDAALFLRRRLFSPWSPDKHFPIMKLPVELREYIFRYALALPPGACMRTKEPRRNCRGDLCERWEIFAPRWHSAAKQYEVDSDFLALLRVSKAFHREAAPCFWSQGIIVSGNTPKLCRLLRGTVGWKYVGQVDLKLRDDGYQRTIDDDDEIALLATMPRLRKLIVRLTPLRSYRSKESIMKVPGVVSLRKHFRGLEELIICGPLELCENVLRSELMCPHKPLGMA